MEPDSSGGLLLPVGQALVAVASATQRDLVDVLARAATAEVSGLLSMRTPTWDGHLLLVAGVPLYAYATGEGSRMPLVDRDAYEHLCLSTGPEPTCQIHLSRLDERSTTALSGLFQRCALVRRLASATELRFLLEIVGGCHFDGCLQLVAGDDRAIVLIHQGRPLGSYTAQSRHIQASLAGSLAAILSRPNPEVAFFPRPPRAPAPLPSSGALTRAPSPSAVREPRRSPGAADPDEAQSVKPRVPVAQRPAVGLPAAPAVPGTATRTAASERSGSASAAHRPAPPVPPPAQPRPAMDDDLAESQMLWLLTALDRQWSQLKDKGVGDAAVLTSLAGMISLCLAKVESVRTGTPDVAADPAMVEDVVEHVRSRFPAARALRAHGSRVDATQLVAELRSVDNRAAERELVRCGAEAMASGLRMALSKLVDEVEPESTREEMRQTCDVYLGDVEAELQSLRSSALAVAG